MPQFFQRRAMRRDPALPEFARTADQHRADAVLRATHPVEHLPRLRYYAVTEGGAQVSVRSRASREEILEQLREKAGGDALVRVWHHGGDAGDAALQTDRRTVPSERHRAAVLGAPTPGEPGAPLPTDPSKAMVAVLQAQLANATPESLAANPMLAMMAPLLAMVNQQAAANQPPGVARIADRIDRYCRYLEQRKTTRSSVDGVLFSLYLFVGVNGNLLLREISRGHCDRFIDALTVWPRNASKRRLYRGMEVMAVVQKARKIQDDTIDVVTQQKHIDRVRSFFRWCENTDEVRPNLLYRVRLDGKRRLRPKRQHRRPFTPTELASIFTFNTVGRGLSPCRFFAPVIGFFTGARVNEIAQLCLDDIVQINGRWLFNLSDDRPGQRIKNRASCRLVPIHPFLIKIGFLRFVEQAKRWQRERLFPDVVWGRNGPGETVSRWFAKMVREDCGITDKGQTFHAFRNTFVYHASRSNIRLEEYSDLTGHAVHRNVLAEVYLPEQDAMERCAVFDRIQFPTISHPTYDPAAYEHSFRRAHAQEQREARLKAAFDPLSSPARER